jgi:hypothetical protein
VAIANSNILVIHIPERTGLSLEVVLGHLIDYPEVRYFAVRYA